MGGGTAQCRARQPFRLALETVGGVAQPYATADRSPAYRSTSLLLHMHQLMGQSPAPFVGPGCKRAGSEHDFIADSECASLDRSRRTRGGGASVDAYRRKIVAQAGLHFCPRRGIQGLASIVQDGEDLWSGSAGQG